MASRQAYTLCRYLRSKMTATNPPTYSLLMWHRRQFSNELDKMNNATQSGLKLTDKCVQVCVSLCMLRSCACCVCVCVVCVCCVCVCVRVRVCVCVCVRMLYFV